MNRKRFTIALVLALTALLTCLGALSASAQAEDLRITEFEANGIEQNGSLSTGAGARPFELTNFLSVNTAVNPESGELLPAENIKDLAVELPPGAVGNPAAFPQCQETELDSYVGCPPSSEIGVASVKIKLVFLSQVSSPVWNMRPPPGMPAQFAFIVIVSRVHVNFHIRTGTDYGVTATLHNISNTAPLFNSRFTLWGVPADPSHNDVRGVPSTEPRRPFLSNPTSCRGAGLVTEVTATTWQHKDLGVPAASESPSMIDCNQVDFSPTVEAKPTTNLADSPSGLEFHLHLPQNEDPDGLAEAHLREAKMVLPPGLTVNASSANGLGSCTPEQIGYAGPSNERQFTHYELPLTNSFTLSYGGESTPTLDATAPRPVVEEAIEALPGLAGNVRLTGIPGGWTVTFIGDLAGSVVPEELSGDTTNNAAQLVEVTGEDGGFNLHTTTGDTGATFETSYAKDAALIFIGTPSRPLQNGDPIEGPGIAPGTKITNYFGSGMFISKPTTSAQVSVKLKAELPFNANAERIQEGLAGVPGFAGNVSVKAAGSTPFTRSFRVVFAGTLAGTEPEPLTVTSDLTGLGAGVVITPEPPQPLPLSVSRVGDIVAGTPQFTEAPDNCPDAAKIGTVRLDTPLVTHPLIGSVFLATPHQNPFGSLLAIYIAIHDPETGVVLKLPGQLEADPKTGQLTATVSENPQLPFEDLRLEFFKGSAAPLKTGIACGRYEVTTDLTPRTAPEGAIRHPKDAFTIARGAGGKACAKDEASAPTSSDFEAGTIEPSAGLYSPFTLKLARPDGAQQVTGIDASLPTGVLAKLAGVPYCSDAALTAAAAKSGREELANPSCPAASRVGTVTVGAGAGPTPFYVEGGAYLAGPYKGAPLSLAVITPAVAGPFDVGDVVIRNALHIDPVTTRVRAVSDPIPTILQGIPLSIRSILVSLDRDQFTLNPTSCNPMETNGAASTLAGRSVTIASPFQVGDCGKLGLKPKLALSLKGGTKRTGHPALRAVLTPRPGDSNLSRVSVALPKSEFLDNTHIKTICTRVQFAASQCPEGSIYGYAEASSPLLDTPLQGPVYLRSSSNKLPDLVADLHGQIDVVLDGRIDSTKGGGLRSTFENVPDAPVSKFVLEMLGGKKGLLENSTNLCAHTSKASALFDGHNTKTSDQKPVVATSCPAKSKRKARR